MQSHGFSIRIFLQRIQWLSCVKKKKELMNLMEDGVLAKEAIDVKKGRKKEERIQLQRMDRMEEEQI